MASRFRVAITDVARDDLRELATYIAHRDGPPAARRQLSRVRTRIQGLGSTPTRGRVPPELAERGLRTWREAIVGPWRIVYRIDERVVHVLAIIDGRRDLSELLLRRLTRT